MNDSLLEKTQARFVQDPGRNVYAKFKINRSSCFGTRDREVITIQKTFLSEILPTMKTATSNSL